MANAPPTGQPPVNTPTPAGALNAQQNAGQMDATSQRVRNLVLWASSGTGRLVMFGLLIWAGMTVFAGMSGFWSGLLAGAIFIVVGSALKSTAKKATPLIKNFIWEWPALIKTAGVVVFFSVWLYSGLGEVTERKFTKIDLHASCEANNSESCKALRKLVAEERAAKRALDEAYGRTQRPTVSVRPAAAVASPSPAPPERKATVSQPCATVPAGALGCHDLQFYDWGTPWQLLVEQKGVCPMIEPGGLFDANWVADSALIEYQLKPALQASEAQAGHLFRKYEARVVLIPPGTVYKGVTCLPLVD